MRTVTQPILALGRKDLDFYVACSVPPFVSRNLLGCSFMSGAKFQFLFLKAPSQFPNGHSSALTGQQKLIQNSRAQISQLTHSSFPESSVLVSSVKGPGLKENPVKGSGVTLGRWPSPSKRYFHYNYCCKFLKFHSPTMTFSTFSQQ